MTRFDDIYAIAADNYGILTAAEAADAVEWGNGLIARIEEAGKVAR